MKPTTKDTSLKFMDYIKNADRILRLLGRIFLVLLVFWILWAFRKAIKDESYVFDTFSVPPALIEKGSPNDGNSWDTYAEVMALKGDDTRFFAYLEKALQNRNPTEGITAELYAHDNRWERFRQQKKFQDLLKKYWK